MRLRPQSGRRLSQPLRSVAMELRARGSLPQRSAPYGPAQEAIPVPRGLFCFPCTLSESFDAAWPQRPGAERVVPVAVPLNTRARVSIPLPPGPLLGPA